MTDGPLTITDAAPLIRSGELTPSELLEQCLARIDRYEGKVRAWVYLDRERARRDAAWLADELKKGNHRGPLHGIPVGVKDIIDVFDMPTGCGSKLWANSYARRDATVVERLRQAGAVIVGKTVTTAYAYLDPPVTRNPWNLERTPGGSSSGSAAAVACGMCLAALGTQTGGSITRPASYCGVCSLKANHGRVSRDGVLPLAPTLDHVGYMARCVRDLALLFDASGGPDDRDDNCWADGLPDPIRCIETALDPARSPDLEFTFLGGLFRDRASPGMMAAVKRVEDLLKASRDDIEVTVGSPPAPFGTVHAHHRVVMAVEAAAIHGDRIRRVPEDYPPRIAELVEEGLRTGGSAYREALAFRRTTERNYHDMAAPYPFVTPATPDAPPGLSTTGDPSFNSPWSFLGYPTISIPVGWSPGDLPLAIQLIGGRLSEAELFTHAAWCEQAVGFEYRPLPL